MLTSETRNRDFPSLKGMIYLNSAAESIPPLCVQDALQAYWHDKQQGMRGRDGHFEVLEQCREISAQWLGLTPAEVSFCSCSAEAYNLLASALNLQHQEEVVISDLDFPSGATPWLAEPMQPVVKLWRSRAGALETADLLPLLNARTRLVQVSLISFYNGFRLDWQPFHDAVRQYAPNALIAVDVTQALGRVLLDCKGADCIISSTHKWVLGLHGGCIVGVPETRAAQLTTRAGGWFQLNNAFDADRFERISPKAGAASWSVGMPNFAAIYALNAGLRYLKSVGVNELVQASDLLTESLHSGLLAQGISPMAPRRRASDSGIVAFQHPRSDAIHAALQKDNIHVMHQAGRLRVSVHGYNNEADIASFLHNLAHALNGLSSKL